MNETQRHIGRKILAPVNYGLNYDDDRSLKRKRHSTAVSLSSVASLLRPAAFFPFIFPDQSIGHRRSKITSIVEPWRKLHFPSARKQYGSQSHADRRPRRFLRPANYGPPARRSPRPQRRSRDLHRVGALRRPLLEPALLADTFCPRLPNPSEVSEGVIFTTLPLGRSGSRCGCRVRRRL